MTGRTGWQFRTPPTVSNVATSRKSSVYQRWIEKIRAGPFAGKWLFAWVFLTQIGHLIEHIAKQLSGSGLLGPAFDTEISHLIFNGTIAILSLVLIAVYPRNPWVYPLCVLSVTHGIEHVYIVQQFVRTGVTNGPGLFGLGGAIGLIPIDRLDLHNVYNGLEAILMALGFVHETQTFIDGGNECE